MEIHKRKVAYIVAPDNQFLALVNKVNKHKCTSTGP